MGNIKKISDNYLVSLSDDELNILKETYVQCQDYVSAMEISDFQKFCQKIKNMTNGNIK